MNQESYTSFGETVGGHNHAVGMGVGRDFDLSDLLKPHLSPALLHWKRTRVSASQLNHNITIARTLALYTAFKPLLSQALPRTGNGQQYWQVKCKHVTLKHSLISPALGKPAPGPDRPRLLAGRHKWKGKDAAQSLLGGSGYLKT